MPSQLLLMMWAPLLGALLVVLLPAKQARLIKGVAVAHAALAFIIAWSLLPSFDRSTSALQFVAQFPWSPDHGAPAALGVDGLSFPMVLLTTLISLIALVTSVPVADGGAHRRPGAVPRPSVNQRAKGYFAWSLILEFAVLGVFVSLSWSLFYVFWEITLIPLFFLISVWGGKKRAAASMSFFLYTLAGSVLMLVALLALHLHVPSHSFGMAEMARAGRDLSRPLQILLFLGFFAGFAVKIPAFPLHGWLPPTYVEAPTGATVMLSGVLCKMGAYGLLRLSALLPLGAQALTPLLLTIGLVNIVYGALLSFRQTDLKAMIAYSSMSHMGTVLLGVSTLNTSGLMGATLQMFTHGITISALFLLVGALQERAQTRDLRDFGGLFAVVPGFSIFMSLALLGSMGLPGLAGFISELHTMIGSFERYRYLSGVATLGVLITAACSLRAIARLFFGPANPRWLELSDLKPHEIAAVAPLSLLIVALGLSPRAALGLLSATVSHMATLFQG